MKNYRPDIDGLRAVAILSVIVFHIDKNIVSGGFAGVDIFFVISGYLITRNIATEILESKFSLSGFYIRRIKRIVPAMVVVTFITTIASQFILLPADALDQARSAIFSLLSMANVYFWLFQDTSYFAAGSDQIPLLHLWSLGIEEQFYLFWPLLMILLFKCKKYLVNIFIIVVVIVSSFVLGELIYRGHPSFAYYMLPSRAGELLIGGVSALFILKYNKLHPTGIFAEALSVIGIIFLFWSLFSISEQDVFPGLNAIPPTLGAALLIISGYGQSTIASKVLSFKPLVWIGLISYSAYLWHWPLLTFLHYIDIYVNITVGVLVIIITFILAWLTYKYVETPFRRSSSVPALQVVLRCFIVPTAVSGFIAAAVLVTNGYGMRNYTGYKYELESVQSNTRAAYKYDYVCQRSQITIADINSAKCVIGNPDDQYPQILLWGDSNASHYVGMLASFAKEGSFSFRNIEHSSCPPLLDDPRPFIGAKYEISCPASLEIIKQNIANYQVVIISANWVKYYSVSEEFIKVFRKTVKQLADNNKLVILIGKVPVFRSYDRLCREKRIAMPFMKCEMTPPEPLNEKVAIVNEQLKSIAKSIPNVEYYDVIDILCPNGDCSAYDADGVPMYYDKSHLSLDASWKIGTRILEEEGLSAPFSLIARWK